MNIDLEKSLELKRYSATAEDCKKFVVPHALQLVGECHEILDRLCNISNDENEIERYITLLETNLCIVRNVLAFDEVLTPVASEENGLVSVLRRVVDIFFDDAPAISSLKETTTLRRVIARVIANASTSSVEWCRALHRLLFPKKYMRLALTECTDIHSALALSLYNICKADQGDDGFIQSLVGSDGCLILSLMLQIDVRYRDRYGESDSLGLLLSYLCFQKGYLETLFHSLVDNECKEDDPSAWLNSNHAYLLEKLGDELSLSEPILGDVIGSSESFVFTHDLIVKIVSDKYTKCIKYNDCTIEVLRSSLHLWRDAMSGKDHGGSLINSTWSPASIFLQYHMVDDYILMLQAVHGDSSSRFIQEQPYRGYASDILSVLANASFRRKGIQDSIIDKDGLYTILKCTKGDPDAPLCREWALWTIRNLCECNPEARTRIQSLEKVDPGDGEASAGEYEITRERDGFTIKKRETQ